MNRDQFISLIPAFKEIQESPLVVAGEVLAYQSSVILKNQYPLGTGFAFVSGTARLIALAEAVERALVLRLMDSDEGKELLLDEYPTSCGFAVGTDRESTKLRALAEAVERWLRSKWIDDGYYLKPERLDISSLDSVEAYFARHFSEVLVFSHVCSIVFEGQLETVHSKIVVGLTESGAFVGSKSCVNEVPSALPALVEAWRHLKLSARPDGEMSELATIKYFAENKQSALAQIEKAKNHCWPLPAVRLHKMVQVPIDGLFCFRVLCEDFRGWHGPDVNRFVY